MPQPSYASRAATTRAPGTLLRTSCTKLPWPAKSSRKAKASPRPAAAGPAVAARPEEDDVGARAAK
eukprot:5329374-Lingulodinium_polyedra.AAC.1